MSLPNPTFYKTVNINVLIYNSFLIILIALLILAGEIAATAADEL